MRSADARPGRDSRVLVVVQLDGGNDGINTVVPLKDEGYARHRRTLRLPADRLVKGNDSVGLHPSLAPFGTADGLVARAAARLTGITRGLDPKAVSVPEVGFTELGREAYAQALAGYASGNPDGVAGWLIHCCRATEHGALEGLAICESLLRG